MLPNEKNMFFLRWVISPLPLPHKGGGVGVGPQNYYLWIIYPYNMFGLRTGLLEGRQKRWKQRYNAIDFAERFGHLGQI